MIAIRSLRLLALVTFCCSFGAVGLGHSPVGQESRSETVKALGISESTVWQVSLLRAERRQNIFEHEKEPTRAAPGRVFVRVAVRLDYKGQEAKLEPPTVELIDPANKRYRRDPNAVAEQGIRPRRGTLLMSVWFASGLARTFVAGEPMPDLIEFNFDVPVSVTEFRLAFGDLKPISFTCPR